MALQVWLPLDGNLDNLGCGNCKITNNGATIENAGKIGKCYSFNGSGNYLVGTPSVLNNDTTYWSFVCWFKPAEIKTGCLFSNRENGNNAGIAVFLMNDNSIVLHNGGRYVIASTYVVGEWNHIVITRSSSETRSYLNGNLVYSSDIVGIPTQANSSTFLIGAKHANSGVISSADCFNGLMNDVRIYDHCLSPAEVHEISQGLVQHFKLTANYRNWLIDGDKERIAVRGSSNVFLDYAYYDKLIACQDTEYTVEFDAYGTGSNMRVDAYFRNASGSAYVKPLNPVTLTTEWEHYTLSLSGSPENLVIFRVRCYSGTAGDEFHIKNINLTSASMPDDIIHDSSGYGRNGIYYSGALPPTVGTESPKYSTCLYFPESLSCINAGRYAMVTDSLTVNIWAYVENSGTAVIVSCTQLGGWSINFVNECLKTLVNVTDVGYVQFFDTFPVSLNKWYMFTLVYDRLAQKMKTYVNGEKVVEKNSSQPNLIKYHNGNTIFVGAEAGTNATAPVSSTNGIIGNISDYRVYCTPLSDEDIAELYHTSAKIDKLGNVHALEFEESDKISIKKNGVMKSTQFCELIEFTKLKYDTNIYIEPDSSEWIRIFHHNNPANGLFDEADDFKNSIYLDENRWFNMEVCNTINTWEIMVKQKATNTSTEQKFRWIQTVNPMIATYSDVGYDNITKINTDGYVNLPSTYGGLYKKNVTSYLLVNNSIQSNTWGRVGAFVEYQGGIAGWNKVVVTTGYLDVYLRINNQSKNTISKIYKNQQILANEFIER